MRTPPKLDFGLWGSHQSTSSSSSEAEQDGGAALERLEAVDLLHHLLDGLVQALDLLLRLQAQQLRRGDRLPQALPQPLFGLELL